MRALITGGAGFIGSHIQDRLIDEGHEVAIVDSLRSGKKENLNSKSIFFEVDVRDLEKLRSVFINFKPEVIFHLAAQNEVPYSMDHPFEDEQINIQGMMNLLEISKDFGKPKIIYSNTGGAYYGDVPEDKLPIVEDELVLSPTSFYGVSKMAAEFYLRLYGNLYEIPWVSLRYSNVFGPRQDGNREAGVVAIFTSKLLKKDQPVINGDGKHTRDYVFVGDVVEANVTAMKYLKNDYFNICTGNRVSNVEVFETIEKYVKTGLEPKFGPPRAGDARHVSLSPAKAKKLLNWEAKVNFDEGVKRTVEYYLK